MNTYVSSNAIGNRIEDVICFGMRNDLPIEFSSNIRYSKSNLVQFSKYELPKITHNYFPASEKAFVFNLASLDSSISKMTLDLCQKNLELASNSDCPVYSCHAGFAFDPDPDRLGNSFKFSKSDRTKYYDNFLKNIEKILIYAENLGVTLLIENNVTISKNYVDGYSPLFCSRFEDIVKVARTFNSSNFGILFDTAHYKVSARTFNEGALDISYLYPYIKALHHSDNNGLRDSNEILEEDYWWFQESRFLPNVLFDVLEIKKSSIEVINQQIELIKGNKYDTLV